MDKSKYINIALDSGFPLEKTNHYVWKRVKDFFGIKSDVFSCPICKTPFHDDKGRIPVSDDEVAIIPTRVCQKCNKSYVLNAEKIFELLKDNHYAMQYTLDNEKLWNFSSPERMKTKKEREGEKQLLQQERLESVESAKLLLYAIFDNGLKKEYVIVINKKFVSQGEGILHYSSGDAKELITAAINKERAHKGTLNGEKFTIASYFPPDVLIDKSEADDLIKDFEIKEKLASVDSSELLLKVLFDNEIRKEFIIVNKEPESPQDGILHYSSDDAKELLTATFYHDRKHKGVLNGEKYVIESFFDSNGLEKQSEKIDPKFLVIEEGGGLYSHRLRGGCEYVDMLLYSPFKRRYEIIKATHDRNMNYYYTDISRFRNFVKENGNPGIKITTEYKENYRDNNGFEWSDLNPQSFLYKYGYNVSQEANISLEGRHEILAEIMDLELRSKRKIIYYIELFIQDHPTDRDKYARIKWEMDLEFVKDYKVNPERFLIAKV